MRAVCLLLFLALVPRSASSATVQEIVALSKAGVSESVILAYIDRDKSIYTIDTDMLVKLKAEGVSEKIVLAMLNSGRAEAEAALQADEAARVANYQAASVGPSSINIGHSPERPNASHFERYYALPALPYSGDFNPVPYALPYAAPYGSMYSSPYEVVTPLVAPSFFAGRRAARPVGNRALCAAQAGGPARTPSSIAFLSVCPQAVQPRTVGAR